MAWFSPYRPGHGWDSWRIPFGFALEAAFYGSHASTSAGARSCFVGFIGWFACCGRALAVFLHFARFPAC